MISNSLKRWFFLLAFLAQVISQAGELRYVPVNPTFGGNPLNSTGLQANATAQNNTKAPVTPAPTALEKFTANIEAAIMSRVQSATLSALFDNKGTFDPNVPKVISAGNFVINIAPDPKTGELLLVTKDTLTGQTTTINISSFGAFQ